jgi:hypothetical protein
MVTFHPTEYFQIMFLNYPGKAVNVRKYGIKYNLMKM